MQLQIILFLTQTIKEKVLFVENFITLKYKYEHGVYDIEELKNFVKNNIITEQEFFEITRFAYQNK